MAELNAKNQSESEFHQAVHEIILSLEDFLNENPKFQKTGILDRIVKPERVIMFRVPWLDDKGYTKVNRGFRIEMNSAIGAYKGGSDFDTKGKSDNEVMRFCQSFMTEL